MSEEGLAFVLDEKAFRELESKMQKLPKALQDKAVRQALRAGAKIWQQEAERRAPTGPGVNLWGVPTDAPSITGNIRVRYSRRGWQEAAARTVSTPKHSLWVEKGHRVVLPHRVKKGAKKTRKSRSTESKRMSIAPNPFMRLTYNAKVEQVQRTIAEVIRKNLDAALKSIGL